jgi:hypothetical protein
LCNALRQDDPIQIGALIECIRQGGNHIGEFHGTHDTGTEMVFSCIISFPVSGTNWASQLIDRSGTIKGIGIQYTDALRQIDGFQHGQIAETGITNLGDALSYRNRFQTVRHISCIGIAVTCAQIYSYYIHHHFRPKDFINNSVIEAKKETLRLKTYYANWLKYISIPFDITFLTWFIYKAIQLSQANSTSTIIFSISFVVIFITMFILAMGQYFKIQRTADEIIGHIEELCRLNEKKL